MRWLTEWFRTAEIPPWWHVWNPLVGELSGLFYAALLAVAAMVTRYLGWW